MRYFMESFEESLHISGQINRIRQDDIVKEPARHLERLAIGDHKVGFGYALPRTADLVFGKIDPGLRFGFYTGKQFACPASDFQHRSICWYQKIEVACKQPPIRNRLGRESSALVEVRLNLFEVSLRLPGECIHPHRRDIQRRITTISWKS